MNALNESARIVDTAWCKGSLKDEAESREQGDTYCAVGAMAHAFSTVNGLNVDWDTGVVADLEKIAAWREAVREYQDRYREWAEARSEWQKDNPGTTWLDYVDEFPLPAMANRADYDVRGIEEFIGSTEEGRMLAETILANFPDRTGYSIEVLKDADADIISDIIISFNDDEETTREEVAAMMEKAAVSYDEKIAFEEKTTDDLVEEINDLIDA